MAAEVAECSVMEAGGTGGKSAGDCATTDYKSGEVGLVRELKWTGAFWIATGVPPLILFSVGGTASVAGHVTFIVFIASMLMGFSQSFTYAEMAGMFPHKSGGASVYGALAWLPYSTFVAPLSVWCNWFAWSPVLSLGCSISAGYILNLLFPVSPTGEQPPIRLWKLAALEIPGLGVLTFNMTFFLGLAEMLLMFAIQHRGVRSTARIQKVLAIIVLVPLLLAGLVPILSGGIHWDNFEPIVPPTAPNSGVDGAWDKSGMTLFMGAMYMGAWTTYGFETAVCYTSELKNPRRDTLKSIVSAGLLCMVFFSLIPFAFQGVMSLDALTDPSIVDGTGIAMALGNMLGGNQVITEIYVILMILALFLSIMTAMAGSSRTLYQGSKDGWLPKYLSAVNERGAPTGAMWTDFLFNVILLALASDAHGYYFVMAVSNVGYITFNFLNLNAGWIHRIDSSHLPRAWRAPTALIAFNTLLSYVNAFFLGAGAKVWGYRNALWVGWIFALLIFPVFAFRHYVQDGGNFPADSKDSREVDVQDGGKFAGLDKDPSEVGVGDGGKVHGDDKDQREVGLGKPKAGVLPYLCLLLGVAIAVWADWFFEMPEAS